GLALAAIAGGVAAASAHRGGWGHGGYGMHGGGRHGGDGFGLMAGPVCNGRGAEIADMMAVRLEHRLKTTDAQKPALEELKAALKAGAAKAEASCPKRPERAADGTRPPRPTAPERLANLEAGLAARLEAVRTVRPAADKFYATLSDDQKQILAAHGEKRRGWWKRGRSDGEEGQPDEPSRGEAPPPLQQR
ncbi:MAG: Spy/CpxP family protein refolding chaperone, partial [Hyphomicrobiaceae bacterium]|nr:Spy/CpxP family protein refolding chaperone [Hyphomicrobiaceae bacterium]